MVLSPVSVCPCAQLVRYKECAAPKDWPLCWTVLPTLMTSASVTGSNGDSSGDRAAGEWRVPASVAPYLRLRSPPPFASVVQHLKSVRGFTTWHSSGTRETGRGTAAISTVSCMLLIQTSHVGTPVASHILCSTSCLLCCMHADRRRQWGVCVGKLACWRPSDT